jgi:hypothetical protein
MSVPAQGMAPEDATNSLLTIRIPAESDKGMAGPDYSL